MSEPLLEVKERKYILVIGSICLFVFGIIMMLCMQDAVDIFSIIFIAVTLGSLVILSIYLLCIYKNHYLKIFWGNVIEYSSSIGKKKIFYFRDIKKIEQKYSKNNVIMIMRNEGGKSLAKIHQNMIGYEKLLQWLKKQQEEIRDMQLDLKQFGIDCTIQEITYSNTEKKIGKSKRLFVLMIYALFLMGIAIALFIGSFNVMQEEGKTVSLVGIFFLIMSIYTIRILIKEIKRRNDF